MLERIIYSIDLRYLVLDCRYQIAFSRLFCSIRSIREYSDIPITILTTCPVSILSHRERDIRETLDSFCNIQEIRADDLVSETIEEIQRWENCFLCLENILFNRDPSEIFSEGRYIPESVSEIYSGKSILIPEIGKEEIIHGFPECRVFREFYSYNIEETEYWIPSQFWNCIIRKKIYNSNNICDFCCRVL